jgi:hypothetical protein
MLSELTYDDWRIVASGVTMVGVVLFALVLISAYDWLHPGD